MQIKRLHWCDIVNVGDAASPFIVECLLGHPVEYGVARKFWNEVWVFFRERLKYHQPYKWSAPLPPYKEKVLYAVGSVLDNVESNAIIWGTGLGRDWSRINGFPDIRAVRGKYTLDHLPNSYDKDKIAIGDPALLLPLIVKPRNIPPKYQLGIIPHYEDYEVFNGRYKIERSKIIDIRTLDVPYFIREVEECEYILSTAMHGLIIAHAYGKPAIWIRRPEMNVGDFKFYDYFSSVDIPVYDGFTNYDEILTQFDIIPFFREHTDISRVHPKVLERVQKALLDSFPKEN